ncbi:MAG: CBS domain-containing protein [Trueperaceae bacterium]|nr:CBS domain-containing protein [Trueperaceae bacterium]
MSSKRVEQLLSSKASSGSVWSVAPDDTVYRALEVMAERNVGALVVLEDGRLAGMLSERDYARKVILKGLASRDARVRDVMTRDVVTVSPEHTVADCMQRMTDGRFRHLPVLAGDRVVGVVSIGDLVATIIADQAFEIEQLQGYIGGGPGM